MKKQIIYGRLGDKLFMKNKLFVYEKQIIYEKLTFP